MHPILEHMCRFWLWIGTGMVTKEWVAVHRLHHSATDLKDDPHSPLHKGILPVVFGGAWLYAKAAKDTVMVETMGVGTPDDWMEKHVYTPYHLFGVILMLAIDVTLFGYMGLIIWPIQMIWVPFWAAGIVNGVGHYIGYRNGISKDESRNIVPIGILVSGEELHNNHHLHPGSPKLSIKWWEFDIGWMYIRIFEFFHLLKIGKLDTSAT